jgi:hypothetical protein
MEEQSMRYHTRGRVVLRRVGQDRLLVPVDALPEHHNRIYPLNESGELIWQSLSSGGTLDEAAAAVTAVFHVEREKALWDCRAFAEELCGAGLLEAQHA